MWLINSVQNKLKKVYCPISESLKLPVILMNPDDCYPYVHKDRDFRSPPQADDSVLDSNEDIWLFRKRFFSG